MSEVHHKLVSEIYKRRAAGDKPARIFIKPQAVHTLAQWCSESVWPSISIEHAERAIRAGRLSILGVQIKVTQ